MKMIWIGIDPGQKGGYAVIAKSETGQAVFAYPWDDTFFVAEMKSLSQALSRMGNGVVAAVEKVGARPGQGTVSMFNFGKSAGYIEGVLSALGIPYQLVPPNKWKKEFSLIGKDKQASIETCRKLFPELDLKRTERCRTDSDGKAEAALLAEYARRHFGEGGEG
jgi:crossover junction endodeoxyribonuclease RuvC